jgi:hypothetical protein
MAGGEWCISPAIEQAQLRGTNELRNRQRAREAKRSCEQDCARQQAERASGNTGHPLEQLRSSHTVSPEVF